MNTLLIIVFVIAYAAIALEHPLKVNKSAPALVGAGLLWTIYALFTGQVTEQLNETLSATAQIVFFLMGAMTIVEVVDAHDGFDVITTGSRRPGWQPCCGFVTFFLSAVLDSLATTIVMLS
jgi:Na+/H+ antiporter NhaD/arsenite permease-like protein